MSRRQMQKMLRLMAGGEPVEVTSAMASVKKLAKLAFVAQQFGYEYADVRQGGANNSALVMLIVPDPSPHARARAAQNWAQYPNAGDGVSLPPFVPDALELLKARINFDLTGKNAEKRMLYGAIGVTVGCVIAAVQGGDGGLLWGAILWAVLMGILGAGFVVTRRRNARFAARLQAAGFQPVADESGRVRYLPPGGRLPGHGNPFAQQQPYPPQQPQPYPQPQQQPQLYPQSQAHAPAPPAAQPYPQQPQPAAAAPSYAPQAPPQQPYGAPGPPYQPYGQQQPHPPQQNPHWQPPQR